MEYRTEEEEEEQGGAEVRRIKKRKKKKRKGWKQRFGKREERGSRGRWEKEE